MPWPGVIYWGRVASTSPRSSAESARESGRPPERSFPAFVSSRRHVKPPPGPAATRPSSEHAVSRSIRPTLSSQARRERTTQSWSLPTSRTSRCAISGSRLSPRRTLEPVAPLRVGIDVSPLALTRAGTARHIRSLLQQLDNESELELRRYGLGGTSRALVPVRDLGWYLAALPATAHHDGMDVPHCPTQRAPVYSPVPLVVTIHDLAVLR